MNDKQKLTAVRRLLEDPFQGRDLTKAEAEAATMVAQGMRIQEVADQLGIRRQAVDQRLSGACRKLGLVSSKELTKTWFSFLKAVLY